MLFQTFKFEEGPTFQELFLIFRNANLVHGQKVIFAYSQALLRHRKEVHLAALSYNLLCFFFFVLYLFLNCLHNESIRTTNITCPYDMPLEGGG